MATAHDHVVEKYVAVGMPTDRRDDGPVGTGPAFGPSFDYQRNARPAGLAPRVRSVPLTGSIQLAENLPGRRSLVSTVTSSGPMGPSTSPGSCPSPAAPHWPLWRCLTGRSAGFPLLLPLYPARLLSCRCLDHCRRVRHAHPSGSQTRCPARPGSVQTRDLPRERWQGR